MEDKKLKNEFEMHLDEKINVLTYDYHIHKSGLNHTLETMNKTLSKLEENFEKFIEQEKTIVRLIEQEKTCKEKINTIEDKIKWVTRSFMGAILLIGINSVYTVKKDSELEDSIINRIEKHLEDKSKGKKP